MPSARIDVRVAWIDVRVARTRERETCVRTGIGATKWLMQKSRYAKNPLGLMPVLPEMCHVITEIKPADQYWALW